MNILWFITGWGVYYLVFYLVLWGFEYFSYGGALIGLILITVTLNIIAGLYSLFKKAPINRMLVFGFLSSSIITLFSVLMVSEGP